MCLGVLHTEVACGRPHGRPRNFVDDTCVECELAGLLARHLEDMEASIPALCAAIDHDKMEQQRQAADPWTGKGEIKEVLPSSSPSSFADGDCEGESEGQADLPLPPATRPLLHIEPEWARGGPDADMKPPPATLDVAEPPGPYYEGTLREAEEKPQPEPPEIRRCVARECARIARGEPEELTGDLWLDMAARLWPESREK